MSSDSVFRLLQGVPVALAETEVVVIGDAGNISTFQEDLLFSYQFDYLIL